MKKTGKAVEINGYTFNLAITQVTNRLDYALSQWGSGARHYHAQISRQGYDETFSFYYSQGSGIKEEPQPMEVIHSIVDDATMGALAFDDFCDQLGFSSDAPLTLNAWKESSVFPDDFEEYCYEFSSPEEYKAYMLYSACQVATKVFAAMGLADGDLYDLLNLLQEVDG